MMNIMNKTMWKFQTSDGLSVHNGYATDARGLRLRAQCGYGWVNMGDGWLQLSVAIRKVDLAERMAKLAA